MLSDITSSSPALATVIGDGAIIRNSIALILILIIAYIVLRSVTNVLTKVAENRPALRIRVKKIIPIVTMISWPLVTILAIKGIFKPTAQTLVAFGASAGIAIGFSVQDLLKNIFGGILILIEQPFSVGDKIDINGFYGEVTHIGLRSTAIQTPDDSKVTIPNSEFITKPVSNSNSGESYCQVVTIFYLPTSVDIAKTKDTMYLIANVSKYTNLNLPITVNVKNIAQNGHSLLEFRLKSYVLDIREEFKYAADLTERVYQALNQ
jgi:small-conductance mechanosensitive channel